MKETMQILGDIVPQVSPSRARAREEREARDLEIINKNADRLNAEAEDVLRYQAEVDNAISSGAMPQSKNKAEAKRTPSRSGY